MGNPTQILTNGLQLVNTNSLRSSTPAQQQNKNMPPRLMIPQIVGTRPGQPGLTFQTLQGLQSGQGHILVKTENGQYQLLRVGPAPQTINNSTNNTNNATTLPPASFRLQAIPACAVSVNTNSATVTVNNTVPNNTQQTTRTTDNTKEKCRKFLANLLELSSREPKAVEKSVRSLIQELVDSKVEPEEFCDRLEKLLNASPQPCLIGFLKKSLPLLRIALSTKEMTIDGITSPSLPSVSSATVVLAPTVVQTQLQTNQIRPTAVQLNSIPHMRGVPQTTVNSNIRPISSTQHRIITPIRVQTAAGTSGISNSKVLTTASSMIVGTTVKIQTPVTTSTISVASASVQTTCTEVITSLITTSTSTPTLTTSSIVPSITSTPTIRLPVPVRQTLIKVPVKTTTSAIVAPSTTSCIATSAVRAPIPLVKTQQQQQQFVATVKNNVASKPSSTVSKSIAVSSAPKLLSKEKDKKVSLAPCASSSAANFVPDDDVNDVAAMAGVNLLEESQRILGSTEFVGTQIRSCKDDTFLHAQPLVKRIVQIASKHGLAEPSSDVMAIVSHAVQERLKNIAEKLSVIAEHRIDFNKNDSQYEVFHDVRGQLKYLEEIDRIERKRQTEVEREILLRAAKSRPKPEDPDHVKLKAKAKEMQRAEIEELRQREANVTALLAIGPRKRLKCDNDSEISLPTSTANNGTATSSENKPAVIRMQVANRPRLKRVTIKDLLFLLEQEKDTCRSPFLYKAYCK